MHWKKELKKGQTFLSKRDFKKALKCFESAVTDCPVSSASGLEKSLYYLGVTLKNLGRNDSALRCWHIAKELNNDGDSTKMILHHSNAYGMSSRSSVMEEDKAAFIGIQIEKYLNMKKVNRFCSDAEKDVVKDIIVNYWFEMLSDGKIDQLSFENKMSFFRNQMIIFPFSNISYFNNSNSNVLYTDFNKGSRLSIDDLCSCGSGLSYNQCCGRIKSYEELGIEDF